MGCVYPAHTNNRATVFWHFFMPPRPLTPTKLSCCLLSFLFFFRGAAELVLLLVHCHIELRADLSFIASLAFISLRCLFNSSDYSVDTHVIKQVNIQNSFSDNVVGGWEEAITAEYLEKVVIKRASSCTLNSIAHFSLCHPSRPHWSVFPNIRCTISGLLQHLGQMWTRGAVFQSVLKAREEKTQKNTSLVYNSDDAHQDS